MNVFIDAVFIFVFVFVLMHFKIIDIKETNVVYQKFLIFIAVTLFATSLSIIKTIQSDCPINFWNSVNSGLIVGALAFVGHTLMFDLFYMPETRPLIDAMKESFALEIILSTMIASAVVFSRVTRYVFTVDCDF